MKVVIINRSDTTGGAAIASHRLLHALIAAGVEANMLVIDKQQTDAAVTAVGSSMRNKWNFGLERLLVARYNGFSRKTLFMIDPATHGLDLSQHPLVQQADVIVLGWINQGMLSLDGIGKLAALGKPIVWVMHDMWNCTGVCHHAYECEAFKSECRACPLLACDSLSVRTQRGKVALYEKYGNIHFVAVSHWLADKCRESSLMRQCGISVIPNAFPTEQFAPQRLLNRDYGLEPDKKVLVMGAARLDDPVKGFDQLIDTTRHIASEMPDLAARLHLLLFGNIKDASLLNQIALPYTHLGAVSDVSSVYAHADVVLSTSLYETLPTTLIEGQASGCLPVTFGQGGQSDIVEHLKTGYIAQYKDPADVAQGIAWAVSAGIARQRLHESVVQKFAASKVAQQYLELFEKLLATPQ